MAMHKLLTVARREYVTNFRRPIYLFMAFVFPVLIGAIMFVLFSLIDEAASDTSGFERIGYVDLSAENVLAAVETQGSIFRPYESEVAARAAYDSNEVDAYFIVSEGYLRNGGAIEFFAEEEVPETIRADLNDLLVSGLVTLAPAGTNAERLQAPIDVRVFRFLSDGSTVENSDDFIARFFLPFGFAFLLYISITITSQFLMSSVVEEKESRMMEVLNTSLRPSELLWGKMFGLGAISLTQITVWFSMGFLVASVQNDVGEFIESGNLGAADLVQFVGLYLLTFFLFAGLSIGVGAVFSAEQEARQFAAVFSFVAVLPVAFLTVFIETNNPIATVLVLFPLTAPTSILLATSYGSVESVFIYVGLLLLIASIFGVMWVAIRLFRAGMLLYGQRLTLPQIWRAIRKAS